MRTIEQDILSWSKDFLEHPNPLLGNKPVCPYAKTARKKKAAGRKGKTVVANTKKAKVRVKKAKGDVVIKIAKGCGKVMNDRRKKTKFY